MKRGSKQVYIYILYLYLEVTISMAVGISDYTDLRFPQKIDTSGFKGL